MAKKKATRKKRSKPQPEVPFETALGNLKQIVLELENGNLSLSDSLEKYEEGIASLKQCHDALADAQQKIELLVDLDENGNATTKAFDDSSTAEKSGGVRRTTELNLSDDDDQDEWDDELLDEDPNQSDEPYETDDGLF